MELTDRVWAVADMALQSMRQHRIAPTPQNFELWCAYCREDKPRLRQRIDSMIETSMPLNPGVLDNLYRDFFASTVDVSLFTQNSQALQQVASRMMDQVVADCGIIDNYGMTLTTWGPLLGAAPTLQDMQHAARTLQTATVEAGERMRALEQLFTASVMRIGELNEQLDRLEREATHDGLTGLANRRMFDTALQRVTAQAGSEGFEVALLLLDIDHFKKFNDTFGHPMGDNVLRLVSQVLMKHIKGRDLAARYGGEEFAIILVGAESVAAVTVGQQICTLLESRPLMNRSTGQKLGAITCSIGVAAYKTGEALGGFVDRADRALYRAKRTGRNRVCGEQDD
jgi:diguanylate cyclase